MLDAAYAAGVDPADAQEFERSEQALGPFRGQVQATRGYAGHESAMCSPPQSAELYGMGGFVMDLLDRAEDHRRGALDRPAHQVPWAVAVLDLGEPLLDRHEFAVRAGGHVAAGQHAGQRVRRRLELQAQDVGKSAFAGFDDGAGVMGDQPACLLYTSDAADE